MAFKNIDQLIAEIDLAVHTDGPLGKTTAPRLNALLRSLAVELTGYTAGSPPSSTNVVQLTTDQRVAGTKTFTDQLVVSQQAAQPKGILVNGSEVYESTHSSASGVRIAVGVNRDGNRQLWIGDDSAYGRDDKGVLRYQTGTRLPRLDAVSGDGNNRMNVAIGTNTSNVAIGGEDETPTERLEVFGNAKANQFIGDGSRLTGIGQVTKYINGALDSRFTLHANAQTYAFTGPAAAVTYAKANALTGLFLFRDTITESIELLDNCTYDATGFDSIIKSGNQPNFVTVGACRASLKLRRIIRTGNSEGVSVAISGAGTTVQLEGDILLDSSGVTQGIFNYSGAALRYRGNIEARQLTDWLIAQHGQGCTTDFVGNILTNTTSHCISIFCLGGVFDFLGRIDVAGRGNIVQCHPNGGGNPWLRLNLLGATTRDKGLYLHNVEPCRFTMKGVIDMRASLLNDPNTACGLYVTQPYQVDIEFENLTILTKPGIPSVKGQTNVTANCLIPVIGKFYATEAPQPGEFKLQNITPYSFP